MSFNQKKESIFSLIDNIYFDSLYEDVIDKFITPEFLFNDFNNSIGLFNSQSNLKLKPGVIEISETGELLVGCKNHTVLKIDEIQIEGKKVVSSKEFIQGYKALIQREIKFSGNAR